MKKRRSTSTGLNVSRAIIIFVLISLLGDLMETLFCGLFQHEWGSRRGVIYGPFSPIYGIGALLLIALTGWLARKHILAHFAVGAILGGGFEVAASYLETVTLHSQSWDYNGGGIPLFGGRTSVAFMAVWGLATVMWVRWGYPKLVTALSRFDGGLFRAVALILGVFMAVNMAVTGAALKRWSDRTFHRPATNALAHALDVHFPDQRMKKEFSNMKFPSAEEGDSNTGR